MCGSVTCLIVEALGVHAALTSLYGHGVGMCQTGAQAMARQGSDYRQILMHYYTGITVQEIPPDLPSTRFSAGDCVEVMPAYSGLELRAGPGEESLLITTLLEGSKGEVVENANNGQSVHGDYWWYVRFGNSIGWGRESGLERCDTPSFGITIGEEGKWQLGCFISSLKGDIEGRPADIEGNRQTIIFYKINMLAK